MLYAHVRLDLHTDNFIYKYYIEQIAKTKFLKSSFRKGIQNVWLANSKPRSRK
ncbi:hypothetical protein IFVP177_C270102 [Vibrio parahaemolyticus]